MGDEISHSNFEPQDYDFFKVRLREETDVLMEWFEQGAFEDYSKTLGFELEAWLADKAFNPIAGNEAVCSQLNDPFVGPELSRFNAEINSEPVAFDEACLERLEKQLRLTWQKVSVCSKRLDMNMLMIGSLPTLQPEKMNLAAMSNMCRYKALNEQVMLHRNYEPIKVDIEGVQHLELQQQNVMLEAAATSLQVHLSVSDKNSARYMNASMIASSFVAAISANSPFMLGKELWCESRVPLFEQSLELPSFCRSSPNRVNRVSFGSGYVRTSIREMFMENCEAFPVLLPVLFDSPAEKLDHLALHNGTIWRWNRPIVAVTKKGKPHLRIEHRVPSSGPSVRDVIANIALYLGLTEYLANSSVAPEALISFEQVTKNFYEGAKYGLDARVIWLDGREHSIAKLMEDELLQRAKDSLEKAGVATSALVRYFDETLKPRLQTGQTGAVWQKRFMKKNGLDVHKLVESYFHHQESGEIVAQWTV